MLPSKTGEGTPPETNEGTPPEIKNKNEDLKLRFYENINNISSVIPYIKGFVIISGFSLISIIMNNFLKRNRNIKSS